MTDVEPEEDLPPVAHVTLVYNGPVAPHWDLKVHYGDRKMLDDFWTRVNARLLLLPKHDPQFRRNRERVNRDAERERVICDWDLGENDAESTSTPLTPPVAEPDEAAEEVATAESDYEAEAEHEAEAGAEPEHEAEAEAGYEAEAGSDQEAEAETEAEYEAEAVEDGESLAVDGQPAGQG
jgi:hypothetical protein